MKMIYQPKGRRAQEYAESAEGKGDGYALNIYKGCTHKCAYCYVPCGFPWKTYPDPRKTFHEKVAPRVDILEQLDKDLKEMVKLGLENNPIHLCFTCDPYPEEHSHVTRDCLLIMEDHGMKNVQVLTKAGLRAERDFDILARNKWKFGSTVVAVDPLFYNFHDSHGLEQEGWEPGATLFDERKAAIQKAHDWGIFTWVSIEPVINPSESLEVIYRLKGWVDLWKIGKLNHGDQISPECAAIEKETDWGDFVSRAKELLGDDTVIWKKSLKKWVE